MSQAVPAHCDVSGAETPETSEEKRRREQVLQQWMAQHMGDPEVEDGWVFVQAHDEETVLQNCWRELPFDIPYPEFRDKMLEMKRHHQRSNLTKATIWTLETVWALSGYASTMLTASGYRTILVRLVVWVLKG